MNEQSFCNCPEILICDDDMFNIIALTALLERLEFSCNDAISGGQCLDMLEHNRQCGCSPYKHLFLDFNMPFMGGIEVVNIIK